MAWYNRSAGVRWVGFVVQVASEDALQPLISGQSHFSVTMAWVLAAKPPQPVTVLCRSDLTDKVRQACPSLPAASVIGIPDRMALGALGDGLSVRAWEGSAEDGYLPAGPLATAAAAPERVVEKPWGREIWWAVTDRYLGKLIEVRSGHSLSLQYHRRKLETLWVVAGYGRFQIGDDEVAAGPGYTVTLKPGTVHRISAQVDLQLIEVSSPEGDDVVRLEDRYGRT